MYCNALNVSREAFRKYLQNKDKPWKYESLAEVMQSILNEDEYNDTYGRIRMYQALRLKAPEGVHIPSENTVRNVMSKIGLIHVKRRKPNGITKADKAARKSDDLLKRDFRSETPLTKAVTDITEIKAKDGKMYVSAIFDCFDVTVLGLAMETNMKATLCVDTLKNAELQLKSEQYTLISNVIDLENMLSLPSKSLFEEKNSKPSSRCRRSNLCSIRRLQKGRVPLIEKTSRRNSRRCHEKRNQASQIGKRNLD